MQNPHSIPCRLSGHGRIRVGSTWGSRQPRARGTRREAAHAHPANAPRSETARHVQRRLRTSRGVVHELLLDLLRSLHFALHRGHLSLRPVRLHPLTDGRRAAALIPRRLAFARAEEGGVPRPASRNALRASRTAAISRSMRCFSVSSWPRALRRGPVTFGSIGWFSMNAGEKRKARTGISPIPYRRPVTR